jgi:diguanylate cyclase
VLRAIGHIADKLGLQTVVEGVEHELQRASLLELGFILAQGFLFAPALPLEDALASAPLARAS